MERLIGLALFGCAVVSILTTVGIVVVLVAEAAQFFREVSIVEFLTGTTWSPKLEHKFGILPLLCGTLLVTAGAAVIALPIGLLSAIYLSEYASSPVREVVKPVLEVLAGIPSVVFGYLAVVTISPMIRSCVSFGRRVQRGQREHRRRLHDSADDRVAERRRAAIRAAVAARSGLRPGRDEARRDGESRRAGGDLGHRGGVPAGLVAGDRRDDGRGARRRQHGRI